MVVEGKSDGRLNSRPRKLERRIRSRKNKKKGLPRKFANFSEDDKSWRGMTLEETL
jgi:hypothetical protein